MNPLKSVLGTIISGFVLAIIIVVILAQMSGSSGLNALSFEVWFHVLAGVLWIGLLYYFNFVQVPGVGAALAEANDGGPGPAAINKYIAPRALLWFRWGAVVTWLTGVGALQNLAPSGALKAFTLSGGMEIIGVGAWLGTIMLFNVWVLIWPNQKKILGIVEASADQIAKAKFVALMASRTNTLLSIPMLMAMVAQGHGLPF
ncbi:MAG: urate hydroxylase PuuD [Thiohalomonadales bacterium]